MGIKKMLVGITMGIALSTTSFAWGISDISAVSDLVKENIVDPAMEINEQKRYDKLAAEQREEERAQEERERRELMEMNERNEKERLAMEERQREKDRELQLRLAEMEHSKENSKKTSTADPTESEKVKRFNDYQSRQEEAKEYERNHRTATGTISLEEFAKLESGMNYKEVCEYIGATGALSAETTDYDGYPIRHYSFTGEGAPGANAILVFWNNQLDTKAQFGLK